MRAVSIAVVAILCIGCGPSLGDEDDPLIPRRCDGVELPSEPLQLVALPGLSPEVLQWGTPTMGLTYDHIGFDLWSSEDGTEQAELDRIIVDWCGESVVHLPEREVWTTEDSSLSYIGAAGSTLFSADSDDGAIRWLDPYGSRPSNEVFATTNSCLITHSEGLVAVDNQGTILFHPEPWNPALEPVEVLAGTAVAQWPQILAGDFTECSGVEYTQPVADGDGVLALLHEGPLVRVRIPDGELTVVIAEPIAQFTVLEDPRYILWRGGNESGGDCCHLYVRDRETGVDLDVGGGTIPEAVRVRGNWVSQVRRANNGDDKTVFLHAPSAASVTIDGVWTLEAALSDDALLIENVREPGRARLRTTTGVVEPLDFPALQWGRPFHADGILGFRPTSESESGPDFGDLLFLPRDGGEVQVLETDIGSNYWRTRDGTVIGFANDNVGHGTLFFRSPGEERREIRGSIRDVTVPHYGTDRERDELLYFVTNGDDAGLWRLPLPR